MDSPKSKLKTYQPALARQLCSSANGLKPAGVQVAPTPCPDEDTPLANSWQQRKAAQRAAREAQARQKEELFRAAMERKRAAVAAEREAAFQQLCSDVLGALEPGSGVLSEATQVLEYAEAAQQARKVALHQQWHTQVFEPIQARLQEALAKTSIQELEASLQSASQAYVNATNTKPIFLDVVIEDDYNPLAPLDRTIRIPTADLDDPLLHDLVKTHTEKNLLQTGISSSGGPASSNGSRAGSSSSRSRPGQLSSRSGANGSSSGSNGSSSATQFGLAKATTRPMLETQRWAAGQIHATPYGHCIDDKTANYIVRPAAPMSLAQKASNVFFDDFTPQS